MKCGRFPTDGGTGGAAHVSLRATFWHRNRSVVSKEETDPFNFEGTFDSFAVKSRDYSREERRKAEPGRRSFSRGIEVMEATFHQGRLFLDEQWKQSKERTKEKKPTASSPGRWTSLP